MAKSLKSVYFDSQLLLNAEEQKLNVNAICNEALSMALNQDDLIGEEIRKKAELRKDNQTMTKYNINRQSRIGAQIWAKAVNAYAQKYKMDISDVLRRFN